MAMVCAGAEGHAFCQSCWCQWLARKRSCPTCRGVIDEATPLIKNRLAERMVGELMSFCPFRDAGHSRDLSAQRDAYSPDKKRRRLDGDAAAATGCTWSGKICDLQAHIDTCDFALQPCKVSTLCTVSLPRGLIAEHERSCPHLRTLCVRCGRLVRVAALEHHKKSSKCHRAQSLLTEYLELLKHSAACIAQKVVAEVTAETATTNLSRIASNDRHRTCDRADCLKMETLLRHYAKCSSRQEGNCPSGVCDHITLLLQLHARDCTVTPRCPVPFCTQWRIPRLSQLVDCVSSPS